MPKPSLIVGTTPEAADYEIETSYDSTLTTIEATAPSEGPDEFGRFQSLVRRLVNVAKDETQDAD